MILRDGGKALIQPEQRIEIEYVKCKHHRVDDGYHARVIVFFSFASNSIVFWFLISYERPWQSPSLHPLSLSLPLALPLLLHNLHFIMCPCPLYAKSRWWDFLGKASNANIRHIKSFSLIKHQIMFSFLQSFYFSSSTAQLSALASSACNGPLNVWFIFKIVIARVRANRCTLISFGVCVCFLRSENRLGMSLSIKQFIFVRTKSATLHHSLMFCKAQNDYVYVTP